MFKNHSVSQRLLISILLVALVPVSLLAIHLYHSAWQNSWREIREKHQLIAENLASPISIYINDHHNMLVLLSDMLGGYTKAQLARKNFNSLLANKLNVMSGFKSISLLDHDGHILGIADHNENIIQLSGDIKTSFKNENCYIKTRDSGEWKLSGIKSSPIDGKPTLIMSQYVSAKDGKGYGVLLAELKVELIEKLRRNVKFGKKGHSAIVDQFGHVIAHPNPAWMDEMRDLSSWPIVQSMMKGKTGVTKFYSSFIKKDMVAGYTSVPVYGWGIMVPQPEIEVIEQVNSLMYSNLVWGLVGILSAVLLAVFLSRWINNPINRLAAASHHLLNNDLQGTISDSHSNDPREVKQLNNVVQLLVSKLQESRNKVTELNSSLQNRIEEATLQLRESNVQLKDMIKRDHLTSLSNRRHFETVLVNLHNRRASDEAPVCIMLIDLDNFKNINDTYGHAAGDLVLINVGRVLMTVMRSDDLIARYGGDEFAVMLRCEEDIAYQRATELQAAIESLTIPWEDEKIKLTLSIGVRCYEDPSKLRFEEVMQQVDYTMYKAKKSGRNCIVKFSEAV